MKIEQISVTVGQLTAGYENREEEGVRGYNGKLDIRPPYQREFIYNEKEQQAVIRTVLKGFPLNTMYWCKRSNDSDVPFEVMDGQQRTLSLCEYVANKFSVDYLAFAKTSWFWSFTKSFYSVVNCDFGYYSNSSLTSMFVPRNFIIGAGLTMGVKSPFGPVELALSKSNVDKNPVLFVNIGFWF